MVRSTGITTTQYHMDRTFTQDELILFIYNELPTADRIALVNELVVNQDLRAELKQLTDTVGMLSDTVYEPSATSVAIIIEDSLSSHLEMR